MDIAQEAGVALEKEMNAKHGANRAKFIKCDVTDDEQLDNAYDTVIKDNGSIDCVINNAGIMNDGPRVYKKEIALNVVSTVLTIKYPTT